ncbi:50S ribosomal protein L32 [Candidatus Falkowbacteria bacterium]|uniref:Large ribosomal subunit protein bL32 n=1 Tax=Candidatus Falkowbacteria bacterium CG10_big_fil_rev_8_21_14_0_10_37_18 TaxID=1974562 RepID=A0A2H0V9N6_9BACT|nr:50S ribosomal protein L32 [Candidatus Falkowbacteria bacterium]NCQ12918.1 50S ribosomal protein L32 [Candidatus Falkowbacteria bacterium]OIO06644.1 MAG: 50S ribosomal protein L32 [Candidatus Falkowbacteria bacterium CG1_02_37_21]PIR95816.1 MAG: 50S ribosomal protein L32 [Candidatus Falkowbacteria bacterium CG10_big_fil_rev_8_21_14_0_10_37_18]
MANPKKQKTHAATHRGRSHLALKKIVLNKCPKCGKALKPHNACPACGYYNGHEVIKMKTRVAKKK